MEFSQMAKQQKQDNMKIAEKISIRSKILASFTALLFVISCMTAIFSSAINTVSAAENSEPSAAVKPKPIYYALKEPIIVNFSDQSRGAVRYMQVKLKVMARDPKVISAFKLHVPAIRHELSLLFYGQNYDELSSTGTKALKKAALAKINEVIKPDELPSKVRAVYFTSFLMQ